MDDKIDAADKKVLVDIVKLSQKRGMKGNLGDWKEFLNSYDKKFGASMSDPAKRTHEVLAAFLKTFSMEDDLKFFGNIMRHHSNQYSVEKLKDKSHDSPEQGLVQITLQHPLYPLDYSFQSIDERWVIINLRKNKKVMRSTAMVAVDCEMVLCEDGTEALVEVCVVDHNLKVKLHKRVKPDKAIVDYRTEVTGVSSRDLETVTCTLADIQKKMKRLLSNGTILVGHSLDNDLRVLKLDHVRVVDTAYIFQSLDGSIHRKPSLNGLCQAVLGYEVREKGAPHNCLDDACAAMKLVLARIKHGVDKEFPFTLVQEHVSCLVSESDMTKLLLHGIPTSVNIETLHKIVPGDFTIEVKPSRKGQRAKYSALATFKNQQEAYEAYENVQGSQTKDSFGRPQKEVMFQQSTGMTVSLFVRKMTADEPDNLLPSKRALQVDEADEAVNASKKAKTVPQIEEDALIGSTKGDTCTHLKGIEALNQQLKQKDLEIESLREQLRKRDFEVSKLHIMISSLKNRTNKTGNKFAAL
ncbi:small RNA degrading nuclease 3-like isoform X1 [Lotus japonicus]|uniref:small RNA degrading nuclease 3-like isoform X1 n=2 Tax=Lotus japonicus TaxID=34305 RepID=UPI00258A8E02|nr:small RNA degrading nuclease 3-like isoform X1 [Lotus japonicus]